MTHSVSLETLKHWREELLSSIARNEELILDYEMQENSHIVKHTNVLRGLVEYISQDIAQKEKYEAELEEYRKRLAKEEDNYG
jgi:hypothetical protein